MILDRRMLMKTAMIGMGAGALPGGAFAIQALGNARGFTHAVASGEPAADSMLFWTRFVPADGGPVELRVEVAETDDFARIVAGGAQITGPWRDHTAKITVDGLQPGRGYHYRFVAPDGSRSPTGRTASSPSASPARTCTGSAPGATTTAPSGSTSPPCGRTSGPGSASRASHRRRGPAAGGISSVPCDLVVG